MKFLILVALFAFAAAQGDRNYPVFERHCSERSAEIRPLVKEAFNVAAYSGTWFEIGRYQQRDESEADCVSSQYSWGFITRSFQINRLGHDFNADQPFSRSATALLAFPDVSPTLGLLNVTYYADREADETNYYVLGTDYFQYAIGWGCENIEGPDGEEHSREFAWLLSRTPELPEAYRERVDEYIERFFDWDLIRDTNQELEFCMGAAESQEAKNIRKEYAAKKMN